MERDPSIDVARGLAILAIVLGHVNRGLVGAGLGSDWMLDLDQVLYLFHISVFAYLAGLYLVPGVLARGTRSYLTQRIGLFLWLYVVWQLVQVSVKVVTASLVNTPSTWHDLFMVWVPEGQLWFFPWLIGVTLIASWWRPWASGSRAGSLLLVSLIVAFAQWGVEPPYAFTRGWALLLPFVIGVLLGDDGHRRVFAGRSAPCLAIVGCCGMLAVVVLTSAIPPTVDAPDRTWSSVGLGMVACALGSAGLLALGGWMARSRTSALLVFLGQRTLPIFLVHIIAAAGTRILLQRIGVEDVVVHLMLGTLMGLVAPILVWQLVIRWRISGVFDLPGWPSRAPQSPSTQNA